MALAISISPASDVPIFRQVVHQVRRALASGALTVGEQLPAVRVLAETLVINPNTVARAYQELIRDGWLESRAGRGVFVAEGRPVFSVAEQERRLRHLTEQLCHEALIQGATAAQVRALLDTAWKELQPPPASSSKQSHPK